METTKDVIEDIIAQNSNIKDLCIIEYSERKDVKQDSSFWGLEEERSYQYAMDIRKEYSIPFWHGMISSLINNPNFSEIILNEVGKHNVNQREKYIAKEEFKYLDFESPNIAINSKVKMQNNIIRHFPMLDFRIEKSELNQRIVESVCRELVDFPGYIIDSGNSYHFIGTKLLTKLQLDKFLGKALLFTPIIDDIWLAHQLIEGSCSLRIGTKQGFGTKLVGIINLRE